MQEEKEKSKEGSLRRLSCPVLRRFLSVRKRCVRECFLAFIHLQSRFCRAFSSLKRCVFASKKHLKSENVNTTLLDKSAVFWTETLPHGAGKSTKKF